MPPLGLAVDHEAEFGIYVLKCKPGDAYLTGFFYYVGFHSWAYMAKRIEVQFKGGKSQSHYCKINKPISVELVWPACSRAAEAYMFYALLEKQSAGWERQGIKKLCPVGGFTQNDSILSPLASLVYEQARRQLKSYCCYNCGGSHTAAECTKPKRGITLTCPHCKTEIEMTSKGQTVVAATQNSGVAAAGHGQFREPAASSSSSSSSSSSLSQRGVKRSPHPPASPPPKAKHAKLFGSGRNSEMVVVSVCGRHYTSLAWYFCKDNPSPSICARARQKCASNALVLVGGHTRSVKDFAKVLGSGTVLKPLCVLDGRPRQRLGEVSVSTQVAGIKIKRAEDPIASRLSQILWLLDDLEAEFPVSK